MHHFHLSPEYAALLNAIGLTEAEAAFTHPAITVWRSLPDRENCTLDAQHAGGAAIRLHLKRFRGDRGARRAAEVDVAGNAALRAAGIDTAPLVAWGVLADGRSFVITENLDGYHPADQLLAGGTAFRDLLAPTAQLAARLHTAGLHHRDLYLCHFFARCDERGPQLKLIDTTRVRHLPPYWRRQRWIVKDLAQFWYSTLAVPVTDTERLDWLRAYADARGFKQVEPLRRSILAKVSRIAHHDAKLMQR